MEFCCDQGRLDFAWLNPQTGKYVCETCAEQEKKEEWIEASQVLFPQDNYEHWPKDDSGQLAYVCHECRVVSPPMRASARGFVCETCAVGVTFCSFCCDLHADEHPLCNTMTKTTSGQVLQVYLDLVKQRIRELEQYAKLLYTISAFGTVDDPSETCGFLVVAPGNVGRSASFGQLAQTIADCEDFYHKVRSGADIHNYPSKSVEERRALPHQVRLAAQGAEPYEAAGPPQDPTVKELDDELTKWENRVCRLEHLQTRPRSLLDPDMLRELRGIADDLRRERVWVTPALGLVKERARGEIGGWRIRLAIGVGRLSLLGPWPRVVQAGCPLAEIDGKALPFVLGRGLVLLCGTTRSVVVNFDQNPPRAEHRYAMMSRTYGVARTCVFDAAEGRIRRVTAIAHKQGDRCKVTLWQENGTSETLSFAGATKLRIRVYRTGSFLVCSKMPHRSGRHPKHPRNAERRIVVDSLGAVSEDVPDPRIPLTFAGHSVWLPYVDVPYVASASEPGSPLVSVGLLWERGDYVDVESELLKPGLSRCSPSSIHISPGQPEFVARKIDSATTVGSVAAMPTPLRHKFGIVPTDEDRDKAKSEDILAFDMLGQTICTTSSQHSYAHCVYFCL